MTHPYDRSGQVDLRGHTGALATYAALVGTALFLGRRAAVTPPAKASAMDVLVGGVATHKLSRLLAKGSVTSPVRAPFTEFEEPAGPAEHQEHARGTSGVRHTIGELLTCPFCLAVWVGTMYVGMLTLAPRPARTIATLFSVVAVSDWLQLGYEMARRKASAPQD
jgi:hypothetical protein